MTPLSARFALPLVALLLLASIPVALHVDTDRRRDDCADPAALRALPPPPGASGWSESPDEYENGVFQWTEALDLADAAGPDPLRFRLVRSVEPASLALMPQAYLGAQNQDYARWVEWVEAGGQRIPVHVRRAEKGGLVRIMAYLFVYAGRPVEHPIRANLASALDGLVGGAQPLTLYWSMGSARARGSRSLETGAVRWVSSAWENHARVCAP